MDLIVSRILLYCTNSVAIMDLRREFLAVWIACLLTQIGRLVVQAASVDSFTTPPGGMVPELDVTRGDDSTGTMIPMKIGADISFPFWIAGTAFPW